MQALELLAAVALVVVWGILLADAVGDLWERSPMIFQVAVVMVAALLGAGIFLVLSGDLVPDDVEDVLRPILFGAVILGAGLLAARESRSHGR